MKNYSTIILVLFIVIFSACKRKYDVEVVPDPLFEKYDSLPNQKIVFVSKALDKNGEIYIMNVDGTNIIQLTDDEYVKENPALSPDGTQILYTRSNGDWKTYEICLLDIASKEITQITNNEFLDGHPDWSPDGKKIIFTSYRKFDGTLIPHGNIFVMNIDGTNEIALTDNDFEDNDAEWSPDGKYIIFKSSRKTADNKEQIFVMDSLGQNVKRLTFNENSDHDPSWAPDSKSVVFMRYEGKKTWDKFKTSLFESWNVYKVDLDGNETKVTDFPYIAWLPIYSSDGKYILFCKDFPIVELGIIVGYDFRFSIMNVDGTDKYQLINDNVHTTNLSNFDW